MAHGLGSPTAACYVALLEALHNQGVGGKNKAKVECDSAAIANLHKNWLAKVSHKRQCEACNQAVLKLLAYMFPAQAERLCGGSGFFPPSTGAFDARQAIRKAAFSEEKVEAETMTIRNRMQNRKPTKAGGAAAYHSAQKKGMKRLDGRM